MKVTEVDVHDDELMVNLELRVPHLQPRDEKLWSKTIAEKKKLKALKNAHKSSDSHFHSVPHKSIPVKSKMIVYLKKNDTFPNTTYSLKCMQSDIDDVIAFFKYINKKGFEKNVVSKYVFNGKTYLPNERPFWFGNV